MTGWYGSAAPAYAAAGLAATLCALFWVFWRKRRKAWHAEPASSLLRQLADAGRIARLNRVYTVLSAVNYAIMHAQERSGAGRPRAGPRPSGRAAGA